MMGRKISIAFVQIGIKTSYLPLFVIGAVLNGQVVTDIQVSEHTLCHLMVYDKSIHFFNGRDGAKVFPTVDAIMIQAGCSDKSKSFRCSFYSYITSAIKRCRTSNITSKRYLARSLQLIRRAGVASDIRFHCFWEVQFDILATINILSSPGINIAVVADL